MSASIMSLFVPRVFSNITSERIAGVFESQGFGKVKRVDLVSQGTYNRAYVHFESWCDSSDMVQGFKQKILNKEQVRVVYDDPYYWIILENTSSYSQGDRVKLDDSLLQAKKSHLVNMVPSLGYVQWLEQENWRLQQTVKYLLQQEEMDVVMDQELGEDEMDIEVEIQAELHDEIDANNLWYGSGGEAP
jgi:hypothetical protein